MYEVRYHPYFKSKDLNKLLPFLIEDFTEIYYPDLQNSPYPGTSRVRKHRLLNKPLDGYYAVEVDWSEEFEDVISSEKYRIVYSIDEVTKTVYIISFDDHNPAYDSAKERTKGGKLYRGRS